MTEQSACLMRAIRGPVMLITVGVLFAFDKFTQFGIGQTWPVFLIVIGLLHLAGGGRRSFRDRRGINAGVPPGVSPGVNPGVNQSQ